ncbi:hypothetical protein PMAYCL1PPCAC_21398, partial [Pristionchus mayeri]
MEATRAPLPFKLPKCANVTHGCPEMMEKVGRLTIYMDSLESVVYVEVEKMTLSAFFSQIGNALGLMVGLSVVGILEILILCGILGKGMYKK